MAVPHLQTSAPLPVCSCPAAVWSTAEARICPCMSSETRTCGAASKSGSGTAPYQKDTQLIYALRQDKTFPKPRHPKAKHWTQATLPRKALNVMSYSPRILRGRKHFGAPSQTAPLDRPSFQEICHKSDECPRIQATGRCKNGLRVQCVRRGVYCTARKRQESQCCTKRTEVY